MNTSKLNIFFILFLLGIFSKSLAFENLTRLYCYDKEDYAGGRQNWAVEIDDYGVVYFGNSDGLLYNVYGEWGLATMTKPGPIRALYAKEDTIWCGGDEVGYFTKINGDLIFHSLLKMKGEMIWHIAALNDLIYFQSENTIILYNRKDQSVQSFVFEQGIWTVSAWGGKMWMIMRDGQIGILENAGFKKVMQTNLFANHEIRELFTHKELLYIVMFGGRVYSFDGRNISAVPIPGDLADGALFTGLSYDDESICLGTVTKGFVQVDNNGTALKRIHAEHGLIDNTILSMKQDEYGNVWLGLDYGIAKIELQSAISPVFEKGATYSIKEIDGKTYLATNKGLFCSESGGDFSFIKGSGGQTWNVRHIDDDIYVCHNLGLFKVENNTFSPLFEYSGCMDLARFDDTNIYLASTYQGVIVLEKTGSHFTLVDNIAIWGNYRLIYDEENDCIWADVYKSNIFKVFLNEDKTLVKEEMIGVTRVFETGSGIFFSDEKNLLQYANGEFYIPDNPLLNIVKGENISALDYNPEWNSLAFIQGGEVKLYVLLPDGNIHSFCTVLRSLNNQVVPVYEFLDLEENFLRLATDRGVTTFNILFNSRFKKFSQPVISSLTILNEGHRQWFYPYPVGGLQLQKRNKDMRFHFSINKSGYDVVEYRYRLEPEEKEWSEWSAKYSDAFYPQVRGGDYRLRLQSRINGGLIEETTLPFSVDKLWYQTSWMAFPYAILSLFWIIGTYLLMSRANERKLKKQKHIYKQYQAEKTLSLKNEQLLQYIEIISHKNEFLIQLKSGLDTMRNKEAMHWANKIAEEVNHEKKEFLFHKLFSEIHQDFISRLTDKYHDLTSNDIRILSFIRLNLDNREISNLMNISQRSLDTNRYRLRKKLNLDHSVELNQFIRDF